MVGAASAGPWKNGNNYVEEQEDPVRSHSIWTLEETLVGNFC